MPAGNLYVERFVPAWNRFISIRQDRTTLGWLVPLLYVGAVGAAIKLFFDWLNERSKWDAGRANIGCESQIKYAPPLFCVIAVYSKARSRKRACPAPLSRAGLMSSRSPGSCEQR